MLFPASPTYHRTLYATSMLLLCLVLLPARVYSVDQGLPARVYSVDQGLPAQAYRVDQELPAQAYSVDQKLPAQAYSVDQGLPAQAYSVDQELPAQAYRVDQGLPAQAYSVDQKLPAQAYSVDQKLPAQAYRVDQGLPAGGNSCGQQWSDPEDVGQDVDISADSVEKVDADYIFTGDVLLRHGRDQLMSDKAIYNDLSRTINFPGSFSLLQPELSLDAERGDVVLSGDDSESQDNTVDSATISGAKYKLFKGRASGSAEQLELDSDTINLSRASYTSCIYNYGDSADEPLWLLDSDSISIDRNSGEALAEDVVLRVFGLPVLYTPWLPFQTGSRRKSGFLPPRIKGSGHTGLGIVAPYYLNLAPDKDATIFFRPTARSGLLLGGEYRYLDDSGGSGTINGEYVAAANDSNRDRGWIQAGIYRPLYSSDEVTADFQVEAERASDTRYLEDYNSSRSSQPVLYQGAKFSLRGAKAGASLVVDGWQSLRQLSAQAKPYRRLPQLSWWYEHDVNANVGLGVHGDYSYFDRDTGVTGSRFDATPRLQLRWLKNGYNLQSTLSTHATFYDLKHHGSGSSSPRRVVPAASLDLSRHLASLWQPGQNNDNSFWHLLHGRLRYNYVPYRNQDDLPLFDTVPINISRSSLWYGRRYTGNDRIGDDNSLVLGLDYSFRRGGDGLRGRYFIGHQVFFKNARVVLDDEPRTGSLGNSSLVQEFALTPRQDTEIIAGWVLDSERGRTERYGLRLHWNPHGSEDMLSLWHSYRRSLELSSQSGLELSLPLGDNSRWRWHGGALVAWRGQEDGLQSATAGIEYRSCCWVLGTGIRHYRQSAGRGYSNSWFLEIQFPGLSGG